MTTPSELERENAELRRQLDAAKDKQTLSVGSFLSAFQGTVSLLQGIVSLVPPWLRVAAGVVLVTWGGFEMYMDAKIKVDTASKAHSEAVVTRVEEDVAREGGDAVKDARDAECQAQEPGSRYSAHTDACEKEQATTPKNSATQTEKLIAENKIKRNQLSVSPVIPNNREACYVIFMRKSPLMDKYSDQTLMEIVKQDEIENRPILSLEKCQSILRGEMQLPMKITWGVALILAGLLFMDWRRSRANLS